MGCEPNAEDHRLPTAVCGQSGAAPGYAALRADIKAEIYRALVLLGAGSDLLGSVGSWGDSLPDEDVLAGLCAWNAATLAEVKGRTEHYEMTCPRPVCSQGAAQQTPAQG